MECPACGHDVLEIDVKCPSCGKPLGTSGAHALIGNVVLSQYEITDVLGQGGMSVVYKAKHRITEQEVALKLLPPELAAHAQVKSRFLEEAKALAQLDHPNIVHLYNFGQENGAFVLAMQFVAGQTWERIILSSGRQPWVDACRIGIDVLRALEYAHGRGIVHRDMKPSNVLVRETDGAATVMDFGIAKMTNSTRLTATGQTMGTVRYMSPEQVRGQEVDVRTDLYSLGATLYEALVGDTPFDGNTHFEIMTKHLHEQPKPPSALGVEVPAAVEEALMRSLAKKPDGRWATARDFRKALEAVLKEADIAPSETQRLARDSIPPRSMQPTAPMGPAAKQAAVAERLTGLADKLEPTDDAPAVERKPKNRTWLWLGLGGLVAVSAGAVALMMIRDKGDEAVAKAPADAAPKGPRKITPFVPSGVTITGRGDDAAHGVAAQVSGDWTPAEVMHVWSVVRERFDRLAADRKIDVTIPAPITIVVVPALALCDARTFDGAVPENCKDLGGYYRPNEQTLLVVDDRAKLETNVGLGVADIACVHAADGHACELVTAFTEVLGKGS